MTEKKRRVKTGCLTCRQRRVKCDEGKPTCQRCQAANVYCEGYDTQRHLETRSQSLTVDSSQASSSHIPSPFYPSHPSLVTYRVDGLPIVGCPTNPDCAERVPHPRARDVLAHHQYTFRTAPLLFKEDHLYFWRDRILHTAWTYEYVYDAVLALGTAHRATLFLSQPYERWKGLDTKVIALQTYGDALQRLSGEFRSGKQCMDIQVGVLLLLVYFECFAGNPVAAFRHLRAAKYYFTTAEAELRKRDSIGVEPLSSCIVQLELVAQVLLPLPNISFLGQMNGDLSNATNCGGHVDSPERLELHRILATHRDVTQCIVAPLHGSITRLDSQQVNALQTDLRRWRDASDTLFQLCDEEPIMPITPSSSWALLEGLTIPPRAQYFPSVKAAITVSLYNCFMAHTMWLLSITTNTSSHPCEITAYFYAYQNLRIAEGLLSNNPIRRMNDGRYFSCESLGMGLSPILYLTARCCYSPTWQQWIVEKLRHMGQEGLFNSEALATSLDLLKSYQHTQNTNVLDDQDNVWRSQSPLGPPLSRALPTVLPDPSGRRFIAFYLKIAQTPYNQLPTTPISLEVVGKASWLVEGSDSSERKRSVDIHTNHLDIKDISQLETELALQAHKWESMFQTPVCHIGCDIDDNENSIPVRPKTPIDT